MGFLYKKSNGDNSGFSAIGPTLSDIFNDNLSIDLGTHIALAAGVSNLYISSFTYFLDKERLYFLDFFRIGAVIYNNKPLTSSISEYQVDPFFALGSHFDLSDNGTHGINLSIVKVLNVYSKEFTLMPGFGLSYIYRF